MEQLVCPISEEKINERVTRFNALFTILFTIAGLTFNSALFIIFLMTDFYIRAFTLLKYSPISYLSSKLANAFNLNKKPIGKAQKIFAARLGFIMTFVIAVLFLLEFSIATFIVSGILIFLASLEFVLGFCVGCFIYSYFVLPFYKK